MKISLLIYKLQIVEAGSRGIVYMDVSQQSLEERSLDLSEARSRQNKEKQGKEVWHFLDSCGVSCLTRKMCNLESAQWMFVCNHGCVDFPQTSGVI